MKKTSIIGIAGGTGSGKTRLAKQLSEAIGEDKVINIAHDDYYLDYGGQLSREEQIKSNFDCPQAYESSLLVEQLKALRSGKSVEQPIYIYAKAMRSKKTKHLDPKRIIIVEGILLFAIKELRDLFDLKIFVDLPADIRVIRRISRDMKEHGQDFDFLVEKYFKQVRPAHLEFVEPSKKFAELIVDGEKEDALEQISKTVLNTFI